MPREKNSLTILGIDPGSIACGYGIIARAGHSFHYVASGTIRPSKGPLHARLREIHTALVQAIRQYSPDEAVIEKVFFAKNAQAALALGHARGVALLAAAGEGLDVHEYSALEVKKALTGYGRAEKRQVQKMVESMLDINEPLTPDSADALALALCRTNRAAFEGALERAIKKSR